jgi:hypothetical protein
MSQIITDELTNSYLHVCKTPEMVLKLVVVSVKYSRHRKRSINHK